MKKLILISIATAISGILNGATYYVSLTGLNTNPGTASLPFQTIRQGLDVAVAGDTIIVKPGTYTEYTNTLGLNLKGNGTVNNPIVLKSEIKWQAVLDGGNVSGHDYCVFISGNYFIIDGFEMKNAYKAGIHVYGNYNRVLNNHIHNNGNIYDGGRYGQDGIYSDHNTHDNTYLGNYIHHNGRISLNSNLDHGLYLCGDNELVVNNIVTYNCAYGIQVAGYSTVSNMKIYNNVFAWNGRSGLILWQVLDGIDMKNNIFYKNAVYGSTSWAAHGTGIVFDHNLYFGNVAGNWNMTTGGSDYSYTLGTNILGQDPLFVDEAIDFHLKPGSPAINGGLPLNEVPIDYDGINRLKGSVYDIGPFKFQAVTVYQIMFCKTR